MGKHDQRRKRTETEGGIEKGGKVKSFTYSPFIIHAFKNDTLNV